MKQLIALLLVVTMTFTSFDVTAFATAAEMTAAASEVVEETTTEAVEEMTEELTTETAEDTNTSAEIVENTAVSTETIDETTTAMETETTVSEENTTQSAPEETATNLAEEIGTSEESVTAEETQASEEPSEVKKVSEEAAPAEGLPSSYDEVRILGEAVEERTEHTKTFLRADGTYLVAYYSDPVHYETEDSTFEEISYALSPDEESDSHDTTEKSGRKGTVKFSNKLKEGKTVTVKDGKYPLSFGIAGAEKKTG